MINDWNIIPLSWSKEVDFTRDNIKQYETNGVYRLTEGDGTVAYIGSAYRQLLKERLDQYFGHNDSGCYLRRKLKKDNAMSDDDVDNYFSTLKVSVCEYEDLEVFLINKFKPKHIKEKKKKK